MEERITTLENDVKSIQERNARVEADKAWETSAFRAGAIACITFLFTLLTLWLIGDAYPLRNALIATAAFLLSIQSLPFLRNWWLRGRR